MDIPQTRQWLLGVGFTGEDLGALLVKLDSYTAQQRNDLRQLSQKEACGFLNALLRLAAPAPTPPPGQDLNQIVREAVQDAFGKHFQSPVKPTPFSSVGETEAGSILEELDVVEVDGNMLEPIEPGDVECEEFDYSIFENENSGTPSLMDHHQRQLQKFGVQFGRNHYAMYDMHDKKQLYKIKTRSGKVYNGGVDACVAPYGLEKTSAGMRASVAYEHKQSPTQKNAYRESKGLEVSSRMLHRSDFPNLLKAKRFPHKSHTKVLTALVCMSACSLSKEMQGT